MNEPQACEQTSGGFAGAFGPGRGTGKPPRPTMPHCPFTDCVVLFALPKDVHSGEDRWAVGWVGSHWTLNFLEGAAGDYWIEHRQPMSTPLPLTLGMIGPRHLNWSQLPESVQERIARAVASEKRTIISTSGQPPLTVTAADT